MTKRRIFISILSIIFVFVFSGCGTKTSSYKIDLEIWGIFDEATMYSDFISKYKAVNPYVGEIKYRKFTPDTYRQDLIEALASGQGPDIFLINNAWLPAFENKLAPVPSIIANEGQIRNNFVDVVLNDFMNNGQMYGMPLDVDSLALYYNKDMFNAAGITTPPTTWIEFDEAVKKLTKLDASGRVIQSGAAMGTARNVNRSADILSVLMMQNGVQMPTFANRGVKFEQGVISSNGKTSQAGVDALAYYTQFTKSSSPLFTWNSQMHYSLDAFAEGSVAMMLNYSYQRDTLKNQNSKLNFAVAPLPQVYPNKPVNFANYEAFVVSKNKNENATGASMSQAKNQARIHESWQFLKYLTMNGGGSVHLINALSKTSKDFPIKTDPASEYLRKTNKPSARRDILTLQKNDPILAPFAYGNIIAKSWFQYDSDGAQRVLVETIDAVVNGDATITQALSLASSRVSNINGAQR